MLALDWFFILLWMFCMSYTRRFMEIARPSDDYLLDRSSLLVWE